MTELWLRKMPVWSNNKIKLVNSKIYYVKGSLRCKKEKILLAKKISKRIQALEELAHQIRSAIYI